MGDSISEGTVAELVKSSFHFIHKNIAENNLKSWFWIFEKWTNAKWKLKNKEKKRKFINFEYLISYC